MPANAKHMTSQYVSTKVQKVPIRAATQKRLTSLPTKRGKKKKVIRKLKTKALKKKAEVWKMKDKARKQQVAALKEKFKVIQLRKELQTMQKLQAAEAKALKASRSKVKQAKAQLQRTKVHAHKLKKDLQRQTL